MNETANAPDQAVREACLRHEQEHGSPYQKLMGYRLIEWGPDHAVVEHLIRPDHINRVGLLHGGIVSVLIDTAAGYAGSWTGIPGKSRHALTLSLSTNFIANTDKGRVLASARRTGGGKKTYFATADIHDEDGRLLAQGVGTFRYIGERS